MTVKANTELKSKTNGKGVDTLMDRTEPGGMKVGFVQGLGKHPGSDATISEIAAYNEFGTEIDGKEHIPERPFLRTTIKEQSKPVYLPLTKELMKKLVKGDISVKQALGILGEKAVADVQTKIDAISSPPNADATTEQKGSSSPLIDTGLLRKSVSWEKVD